MAFTDFLGFRWLTVPYAPRADEQSFLARSVVQRDEEIEVSVAVLDDRESKRYFGVPLARRGIQPVFVKVANNSPHPYRLRLASLDPSYYPPLEAAYACHFKIGKRLVGFGLLAWFFLPLVILLPFKFFGARAANRRMNSHFQKSGFGWGFVRPGQEHSGFVFTTLDEGTKQLTIRLQSNKQAKDFPFAVVVPGLNVDHGGKLLDNIPLNTETIDCDDSDLRKRLADLPRSTTNRLASREGDPLNLVAIGDFETILRGFGARWDETESITLKSCWRMFKAFFLASNYRYSPVSPLYVAGRSQDFSLQKARQTIDQRLHLRLWLTPLRYAGKPVWIGQISRDIGVRFTLHTWNLTTHKIDPDVDDARDYLLDDLMEAGRVKHVSYVPGVQDCPASAPRHNLTGDPYFTDGFRAVAVFSEKRTAATYMNWA